jgi:hypothetical protein
MGGYSITTRLANRKVLFRKAVDGELLEGSRLLIMQRPKLDLLH